MRPGRRRPAGWHPPADAYEFSAVGYFTGNIDSITFKMHNIFLGQTRATGASTVDVRMLVDGESVFGLAPTTNAAGTVSTEPAEKRIQLTPQPTGATGAAALYTEAPSGLTSNPAEPAAVTIPSLPRADRNQ